MNLASLGRLTLLLLVMALWRLSTAGTISVCPMRMNEGYYLCFKDCKFSKVTSTTFNVFTNQNQAVIYILFHGG